MVKNRIIHILFVLLVVITISAVCNAQVRVKGYYRKDGTYVRPHVRSNPDRNPYNNWTYPGNVNPYTGKVATGNPETYLKKYQKGGNHFLKGNKLKETISNTQGWVSTNVLNVRLSPSVNSSIVGKLNYSDIVEVHGVYGNWAFVRYRYVDSYYKINTLEGYASIKYLIIRKIY
ncbi:MAG: SH3 domain-containing protein [Bacteroides thetaiotaomicron]